MFKRHHQGRRHTNIVFVIFRLILSFVMFAVLIAGIYSAYKYFSGYDPLKLDPVSIFKDLLEARSPQEFIAALPAIKTTGEKILGEQAPDKNTETAAQKPVFQFLLIGDTHNDNEKLSNALSQAKNDYPDLKFIIGLGDYTDVGTVSELGQVKEILDASGLRYFLTAGDHDLWDCRNRNLALSACFGRVFGPAWQTFAFENFQFLLLDNSDNYLGFGDEQRKWIETELEKLKENPAKGIFVFLHEPLFHPSSEHIMGKTESLLKEQAKDLIFELKAAGVKKVFAGDTHFFSQYSEPVTGLSMVTIGAVTTERNPQTPRFAVVSVFEDGNIKVDDVEIK